MAIPLRDIALPPPPDRGPDRAVRVTRLSGGTGAAGSRPRRLLVVGDAGATGQGIRTSPKASLLKTTAAGAGLGATFGTAIPGIGNTIGSGIGAIAGFAVGIFSKKPRATPLFEKWNENVYNLLVGGNPAIRISQVNRGARGIKFFRIDTELPAAAVGELVRKVNQQWVQTVARIPDAGDQADIRRAIPTIRLAETARPDERVLFEFTPAVSAAAEAEQVARAEAAGVAPGAGGAGLKAAGVVGLIALLSQLRG